MLLAVAAAACAVLTPPPEPGGLHAVAHLDDAALPWSVASTPAVAGLSAGAPSGAIRLTGAPAPAADPQPAVPAVITGLAANGIPDVALNAYRVAAARIGNALPSCGLDWSLLAGIGRVESNHGRFGGAVLNPDRTSTPTATGWPTR